MKNIFRPIFVKQLRNAYLYTTHQAQQKPDRLMARIDYAKKEIAALRIVNRCSFISEQWEQEWMLDAIRAAFRWAEWHSASIDPDAPYAMVRAKRNDTSS